MKNLFIQLLDALSVPYTVDFADELYATHPNRDNMLGLFQMCEAYGITAKGVKIMAKNFDALSIPSVLHAGGQFVILTGLTGEEVTYDWNGQTTTQRKSDFAHSWDGQALLIASDEGAMEPSFTEHRKQDRRKRIQSSVLACLIILCGGMMFFHAVHRQGSLSAFFAAMDALGIGACCLLLQKQAFQDSKIGDKVCSMFHQKDCNDLLHSDKAKIYGYSWSEIGLGYFVAHFLTATLLPSAMPLLSVIGWCAMGYGVWSVYYQARVARQWCVLCMLVQTLLWANGITSVFLWDGYPFHSGFQALPNVRDGICFLSAAVFTTVAAHQAAASVALKKTLRDVTHQYRSLKCNVEVFKNLLHQKEYVPTGIDDSTILFGNERAQLRITVLTTPHCNPCAAKHKQIDELLERHGERLSVQYIFLAFNEGLKQSNRFLIAIFQQLGSAKAREAYRQWYAAGKDLTEAFMAQYPNIHCETPAVEQEMRRHAAWIARSGFFATPTILVNGYALPSGYDLADLPLFTDIQL